MSDSPPRVAYVLSAVEGFGAPETLARYGQVAGPAIELFGGRFLVSNSSPELMEGESQFGHLSVVEFPSMSIARAWYESPENAEAREITPSAFIGRVLMFVEGTTVRST